MGWYTVSALEDIVTRTRFTRTFEASIVEGDGRTLDLQLVPYDVEALVADPPDFTPYRESFARGAFAAQLRAPDRVRAWLNFEHEQGLRGILGHGVALEDHASGLRGRFRVHSNADGDKALQLVHDGLLTGCSIEYVALRSQRVGGVMRRVRAHFDKVSLCRFPAYADAGVLAVRQATMPPDDQETCATCDHPAAMHAGDDNSGACTTPGCDCDSFSIEIEIDDATDQSATSSSSSRASVVVPAALAGMLYSPSTTIDVTDYTTTTNVGEALREAAARELPGTVALDDALAERLRALDIEPLRRMAMTSGAWDGSPSRFSDDEYGRSALVCRAGDGSMKERCSMPVLEPDGTLNVNALGSAAGALAGARGGLGGLSPALRAAAARKLVRYYNAAGKEPPPSLLALARS